MRFITEFELTERELNGAVNHLYYHKKDCYQKMESMMNPLWQNPVNGNPNHHRLEIEAFPMDKWIEFRKKLIAELPEYDAAAKIRIMNALSDLEHYEQSKTTK
jgi:hypothetical protein